MIPNWSKMNISDPLNHLGSIWYHSEPLEVPYFPNQFLFWGFIKATIFYCIQFDPLRVKRLLQSYFCFHGFKKEKEKGGKENIFDENILMDWTKIIFFFSWWSPSVISFFPISEFSYKLIGFLLHRSVVKSDNEIGKFSYVTGGLGLC